MCRYCKNVLTGDDWKDLLNTGIYISAIETEKHKILEAHVGITSDPSLELSIFGSSMVEYGTCIPIKYCPMCGTKLKDLKCNEED